MAKPKNLGEFEMTVLAAVLHAGSDAYGTRILDEIRDRTGRTVSVGALYATLSRMENKALVRSELGEATAARGGRAKKFFHLTDHGRVELARAIGSLNRMVDGLNLAAVPA
ncbi:MAG: helix-turn-helix transcriptional regulator [Pseudomonadota bacterium]